ncbi:hypothetical protein ABFS83_14G248600 [Erythranthe nasuta]
MAIEKNNTFKVARFDPEYHSLHSRDKLLSSDDEDFQRPNPTPAVESDEDDDGEFDECDSGAGSDDFDLLELGETGEEFCQVEDQTCSIPYELYDLPGLKHLLSMEVWNECLTEEERFGLARYLPDMDQENFVVTLKELFAGDNLHFGSPVDKLFDMLKGGLCEPRVALYRRGWKFFQRRQHYHNLRKHQNSMVNSFCQMRDTWLNYRGYSIEEKLRVLNIMKSEKSLMNESSDPEESGDDLWGPNTSSRGPKPNNEPSKHGKQKRNIPPTQQRIKMKSGRGNSSAAVRLNEHLIEDDDEEESIYEVAVHREKPEASKFGKKREGTRAEDDVDTFRGIPISVRNDLHAIGRNRTINQLSDIEVLTSKPSNAKNISDRGKRVKYENLQHMKSGKSQKSNSVDLVIGSDPAWLSKQHGGLLPPELSYKPSYSNAKNKKWKMGKEAVEFNDNYTLMHADHRAKPLEDTFAKSEETESDSSEQMDENEDGNPLMRSKWAYPGTMADSRYVPHTKKGKFSEKDKKGSHLKLAQSSQSSQKFEGNIDLEAMKAEQKGKMHNVGYLNILPTNGLDKDYFSRPDNVFYPLGHSGHVEGNYSNSFHIPSLKSSLVGDRRVKGEILSEFDVLQSTYMHDYKLQGDLFRTRQLAADNGIPFELGRKNQMMDPSTGHHHLEPLMGCSNLSKKRKIKHDMVYTHLQDNNDYLRDEAQMQLDNAGSLKKRGKNKLEDVSDSLEKELSEQPPILEMETEDFATEAKPQKKPFPLITPTVHSGFSFSIIHLLSAVRTAMITLLPEDSSESRKHLGKNDAEQCSSKQEDTIVDINASLPCDEANNVPSLTVQEIVSRVRSNPGDPSITETQEPLQDLVRSVLRIFASRTAPLGAKGWKPLVVYERSSKSWTWVGPVSRNLSDSEAVEEVTSPDYWGLPHRMLVKLVDSFANWLKNSQDALQQIGTLPSPPSTLVQINLDEKERFKDTRAQKSLSTISPSSEEVRAYFQKEEVLRYLIPDRAFSYTAIDGKKSIVAPLRRCGGKPTSKARDHFMLKRDRPPHVTILCLVRDAAARLPGSIGTRADVCTLIRDSQYVMEDVSDAQVNQVVSGALDRLHYERDPCVQFDGERKLWVYLHREREEEDFEDDGTSSTKKWRRQKKEATEAVEQSGFDLDDQVDDNAEIDMEENKLLGQENNDSTDIGFHDGTFGGEPPA